MVANSHVAFLGPVPTPEEYADAAVKGVLESLAEQDDPTLRLKHVQVALQDVAACTKVGPGAIHPFLSSRRSVDGTVNINVEVRETGAASPPTAKIKIGHVDPEAEIQESTLREYCVDFQECA